ncbi:MAG: hypothetical protein AB1831_06070 [Pseudomonadota bacterium]
MKSSLTPPDMHTTGNLQRQFKHFGLSLFEGVVVTLAVAIVSFGIGYPARTWPPGVFESLLAFSFFASFFFCRKVHLRGAEAIALAQSNVTAWHRLLGFVIAAIVIFVIALILRGVA